MKHLYLFLALAVATLLGCSPEDFSPTSLAESSGQVKSVAVERPFKAQGDFSPAPPAPGSCPIGSIRIGFDVDGTATHLGQFTGLASQCLSFSTGIAEGTVSLRAANGDGLTLAYISVPVGQEDGLFVFLGEYEVIDGTGRFLGASGSGTLRFLQEPVTNIGTLTTDGVLVY